MKEEKMFTVWVTKNALTSGIGKHEAETTHSEDMVCVRGNKANGEYDQHFHGKDWHTSEKAAKERAEEMRIKKLKSLDKQMKKISALVF
ncbi:hypothetical protein KAR91_64280 [Candidatus Pacearchaeota archaeon]|nr:hypothetical protein [Candidatus Pacearchaeota archaeon]